MVCTQDHKETSLMEALWHFYCLHSPELIRIIPSMSSICESYTVTSLSFFVLIEKKKVSLFQSRSLSRVIISHHAVERIRAIHNQYSIGTDE
jgi:hypothetical protein